MKLTQFSPFAAALALLGVASPAFATQFGPPPILPLSGPDPDDVRLDDSGPDAVPALFDEFLIGDLVGDGDRDGLLLATGEVHAILGLGRFSFNKLVASGVSAVTIENPINPGGGQAVLVVDAAGLHRYVYDSATATFVGPTTLLSGINWQNAPFLRAADLNGQGRSDLLMVGSLDSSKVIGWKGNSSASFSSMFTITVPGDVLDVRQLDWGNDGIRDLAILSTSELRIVNGNGVVQASWSVPVDGGEIEIIADCPNQPGDRVAWVRPDATDSFDELLVLEATQTAPTPIRMQFVLEAGGAAVDLDVIGLAAGDSDDDGDFDLGVFHTGGTTAVILGNVGTTTPSFGTAATEYGVLPVAGALPGATASGSIADVRGDGSNAVLTPVQDAPSIAVEHGLPIFGGTQVTFASSVLPSVLTWFEYEWEYDTTTQVEEYFERARMFLDLPPSLDWSNYTHVLVQGYEQADSSSSLVHLPVLNHYLPLPAQVPGQPTDALRVDLGWGGGTTLNSWTETRTIYLSLRLVDRQGSTIIKQSAWYLVGMTLKPYAPDQSYASHLTSSPTYYGHIDVTPVAEGSLGLPGTFTIGITAELGRLGDFGSVPVPTGGPFIDVSPLPGSVFFWEGL